MIFDGRDLLDTASRNVAPAPPATLGEAISSSFGESALTQTSVADDLMIRDTFQAHLDRIERETGKRFQNPMDALAARGDLPGAISAHRRSQTKAVADLEGEFAKLREQFPDVDFPTMQAVLDEVARTRADIRGERADVARREVGFAAGVASFLGASAGVLIDPPLLASMAFGAPVASGILRTTLVEAGAALTSEALIQAAVQAARPQFGEDPSLSEAVSNVALATGGTAALTPLLMLGGRALRGLSPAQKDAATFLKRKQDLEDLNPFDDTPAGRGAHVERLDTSIEAARAGRPPDVPDFPTRNVDEGEAPLTPDEVAVVQSLAPLAEEPARFGAFLDEMRHPPKPTAEQGTLLQFIRKTGGTKPDPELQNIGLTARQFPGVLRKVGRSLDEVGEAATEAGFFRERPLISDVVEALDEEINRGRPLRRAESGFSDAQARQREQVAETLRGLDIDVTRLKDGEIAARLRDFNERIEAAARIPTDARPATVDVAALEAGHVERATDAADELDVIREQEVRALYEGREGETILIENEDGAIERMTVEEMFNEFEFNEDDLASIRACVGGSGG